MEKGLFCFLSDQYYIDFPDERLMRNKETIDGISHRRPCFFAFPDGKNPDILWLVPVSSKYDKYKKIYDGKVEKYKKCNTIRFGTLLGKTAAFLIQNMCPVTEAYICEVYLDKNNNPIHIDNRVVQDVISNAREVLSKQARGAVLIFPDVASIKAALLEQLREQRGPADLEEIEPEI